ncbi:MAG: DUF5110 domain-containing protein, partial [Pseudomonadota bacterium]
AGTAWYDYWTNQRYEGGQTIEADAPISRMPLFVKAGSIIPTGVQVKSTAERQALEAIRVYPGADARFVLYDDDGTTNGYRKGGMKAELVWNDQSRSLTSTSKLPTGQAISGLVQIVGQ